MTRPSHYIHGTDRDEQDRLSRLNDLLNEGCLRELALSAGERVLDFGAGLGQLSRAMARAVGKTGSVVGIERSADQIAEARRQAEAAGEGDLVELREGDVGDPPLTAKEWGTFDVAHARFILEHVHDPLRVVRQMVRAVRPAGRIVLADDDHEALRLWPEPPGIAQAWRAYVRTYDRHGNDPIVGRRLVALLHAAGARPKRNTAVFFGACSGQPTFPAFVENLARILVGAREPILETGEMDVNELDAAVAALRAWGARPDSAFWFYVAWAEGVKP